MTISRILAAGEILSRHGHTPRSNVVRLDERVMPPYPLADDDFLSPLERVPNAMYNAQRATYNAQEASQQAVWDMIARDHPRKLRRAVRYLRWLDRMQEKYSRRL